MLLNICFKGFSKRSCVDEGRKRLKFVAGFRRKYKKNEESQKGERIRIEKWKQIRWIKEKIKIKRGVEIKKGRKIKRRGRGEKSLKEIKRQRR